MAAKIRELEALLRRVRAVGRQINGKLLRREARAAGEVDKRYLRQVFMRFLVQPDARDALVPVILRLLGANEPDVQVALRQWTTSG